MQEENLKEFIKKKYLEYKKIGNIKCPAFGNEEVYFNKHGFGHLIRKEGIPRTPTQQIRRITLLQYAPIILGNAETFTSYKKDELNGCIGHFWTFEKVIGLVTIRVVVRQLGNGRKHFFSIMDRA